MKTTYSVNRPKSVKTSQITTDAAVSKFTCCVVNAVHGDSFPSRQVASRSFSNRLKFSAAVFLSGFLLSHAAFAANITWSDTAGSTAWATGSNWVGGVAPVDTTGTDNAVFNSTSYTNQPNYGTRSINQLIFGDGTTVTAPITLSGTSLSVGGAITMNANAGAVTIAGSNQIGWATQPMTNNSSNLLTISAGLKSRGGSGTSTFTFSGSGNILISGAVGNGTGANTVLIVKSGTGTLTLTGTNTYSNTTTINANGGTLEIGGSGSLGSGTYAGAIAIGTNSVFHYNSSASQVLSGTAGPISGSGSVVKSGTGTLTLSGINSYSGTTTINAGILNVGNSQALGGGGSIIFGGGTLQYSFNNQVDYSSRIVSSGSAIGIDTNGQAVNYNTSIAASNTGGLTKLGAGTLTLNSTNNYTGTTTVTSGTLVLGHATNTLADASSVNVNGGTLDLGANSDTVGAVTLTSGQIVGSGVLTGTSFNVQSGTAAATLSGSGVNLTKSTSGVAVLSASNTYTGSTDVTAGVLDVLNNSALGTTAGQTSVTSGATVRLGNGITVTGETITIAGTGPASGTGAFNGSLQAAANSTAEWAGNVVLNSSDARIGSGTNATLTVSGGISGSGANQSLFIGTNSGGTGGAVILSAASGNNTYTGLTGIIRGTLKLGADNTLPTGTVLDVDTANADQNAIFDLNGFNQTVAVLQRTNSGAGAGAAFVTNNGTADKTLTITGTDAGTYTYSGSITDGTSNKLALVKNGPSTEILSGSNSFTGATTINDGTLQLGSGGTTGSLSAGSTISNNGTLVLNRSNTVTQGTDFAAAISGTGALIQSGSGTLVLGANTYSGPTSVNAGRVDITSSLTSNVTVANGANLGGEGSTTGSLTFSGASTLFFDPATVGALTANSLDASGATVTLSLTTAASGTNIVVIDTSNPIIGYTGTNFVFTGRGTTYLGGTNSNRLLFGYTPGNLKWTGTDGTNPSYWDLNTTANWSLSGSSATFFNGDSVTFDDTAPVTASFNVVLQTPLQTGTVTFDNSANAYTVSGGAILNTGGSPTSLVKTGTNNVLLSSSNGYTGGTTISAGSLTAADLGALGTGGVTANGALNLTAVSAGIVNYTGLSSSLSGTGTVNVTPNGAGTATVNLNGTNSGFTGVLNVGVGALAGDGKVQLNGVLGSAATVNVLSNGSVLITGSTVNQAASIVLNGGDTGESLGQLRIDSGATWSGPVTLAGAMTGSGDGFVGSSSGVGTISGAIGETGVQVLSKVGSGTIVLTNSNSYTGGTALNDGFLTVSHNNALGSGTVVIGAGAERLTVTDGIAIANNIAINGGGVSSRGLIENSGTGNAILTGGTITMNANASAGGHFGAIGGGTLTVASVINSGSATVTSRLGTVIFSGGGSYANFGIQDNTVRLGANDGLSTAATLGIGTANSGSGGVFDLAGYNQSLVGITKGPIGATIGNSGTNDSLLTLTGSSTYAGTITNAVSGGTMKTALAIANGATLTYTGGFTAESVTISGGATLVIGAGGGDGFAPVSRSIVVPNGGLLKFGGANRVQNDTVITVNVGGTFDENGNTDSIGYIAGGGTLLNNGGLTLTLPGVGSGSNFSGSISGSNGFTLKGDGTDGPGMQIFSGSNSFTGGVNIQNGVLRITNAYALGSGSKTITITQGSGATPRLELDGSGGDFVLPSSISFTTSGLQATGVVRNIAGNNTIQGNISLTSGNGNSVFVSDGGSLTLSGSIGSVSGAGATRILVLSGSSTGANTVSGRIVHALTGSFNTGVQKDGAGTWTLSGANTYRFSTTVNSGTLAISGSGTLGLSGSSAVTVGAGTLDLGTTTQTVAAVSVTNGSSVIQNGSLVGASYAASNASGNALISAKLLANGSAGLTKTGNGTLTLSASNSYTGLTDVQGGTLEFAVSETLTGGLTVGTSGTAVLTAHTGTVKVLDITGLTISGTTAFAGGGGKDLGGLAVAPVPEPGTIGMLAIGAIGGLLLRRRCRRPL